MFIIEYRAPSGEGQAPSLLTELALGSTAEEAMDQADRHLRNMTDRFGVQSYRIIDSDQRCVGIGPEGFFSPQSTKGSAI